MNGKIDFGKIMGAVWEERPLVHSISNYVTAHDVANVILACGANPIMTDEPEDVRDIDAIVGAININLGTLNRCTIEAMRLAAQIGKERKCVMVLDPVGAGASRIRTEVAGEMLATGAFDVVKGNISEIMSLAHQSGGARGVDARLSDVVKEDNLGEKVAFCEAFAKEKRILVAVTGAIDIITDGEGSYVVRNGVKEMGRVTGTGCQLSGMVAAYVGANRASKAEAVVAAVCMMGVAGEVALERMQEGEGNATYGNRIIDAISNLTAEEVEERAKYEVY